LIKARKWLKQLRKKQELTQTEVANLSGISLSHYAQIESGSRSPSVSAAKRIARTLNFSWHIFFDNQLHSMCNEIERSA
jgi:transcriptional regulator with XRE-family HTH domain